MLNITEKRALSALWILAAIVLAGSHVSWAEAATTAGLQSTIDANTAEIADLNQKIAEYQADLAKVGADKKTLQAAINTLTLQRSKVEAQISVTEHQIDTTQLQMKQLGSDIANAEGLIADSQSALGASLRDLEKNDTQSLLEQMLSSETVTEAWSDIDVIAQIQSAIVDKVHALEAQKNSLSGLETSTKQKQSALASQKQSLTSQQASLAATKQSKDQLLTETSAEESKYQALLAAAKAQLLSFSAFSTNAGGSGLLSGQTKCDTWGCYYNQRDSAWGNIPLNGTTYRMASDGCLITAVAMVMTHYGYSGVTPEIINADPSNFAAYYPAYLLYTVHADGASATRSATTIDATLATGNPVIVGLHAYGGTHFVVLVSGAGGKYVMRDPYIANGNDINFSDHYSLSDIYEINKVKVV